jgi:hypothetical protein
MKNTHSKTKNVTGGNVKTGAMPMLDKLHAQQVEWNDTLYKSANDRLLVLLGECLAAYEVLRDDRAACKQLNARLAQLGLGAREGTHLTMRIVRYVFRITNSRASAYARVLRSAAEHKVDALQLKQWVTETGGIEAVRRKSKGGLTPAQMAAQLCEDAGQALATAKPVACISKLPQALKPDTEAYEGYTLALVRFDKQTGAGDIVWGSANAVLTKRFLSTVGKNVLEKHKVRKLQSVATNKRAKRAAAINAPVAANDSSKKIAA